MRHGRLIVQEWVSADGYVADAAGDFDFGGSVADWSAISSDQLRLLDRVGTIVLGRRTYEMFAAFWPGVDPATEPVAEPLNALPKVVFSETLPTAPWGDFAPARIDAGDLGERIARLRSATSGDLLVWGSISLAQSLLREGLVDELRLYVCPVALGAGRSLFPDGVGNTLLTLRDVKAYPNGAYAVTYALRP